MPQHDLTETLQVLVRRHGMSSVLHSLADIQASPEPPISSSSPRVRTRNAASKSSAVDYVARMTLPPDKAEIMSRAAQRFEAGGFLPAIADIREFCRIHGVELGKSNSRASSIPRVFTFLAAMDTARVIQVLAGRRIFRSYPPSTDRRCHPQLIPLAVPVLIILISRSRCPIR